VAGWLGFITGVVRVCWCAGVGAVEWRWWRWAVVVVGQAARGVVRWGPSVCVCVCRHTLRADDPPVERECVCVRVRVTGVVVALYI